ncbi:MAG TPA: ribosome maturation factor RimM [Capsulimonadaceae bacterium]
MSEQSRYETLVGTIVGAHGIQGAVKVKPATPAAPAIITPAPRPSDTAPRPTVDIWLGKSPDDGKIYKIVSAKKQEPKNIYLVKLIESNDRNSAESLVGSMLFVHDDLRPPLDSDEYFVADLIGLEIVTDKGRSLGKVTDVLQNPANDVYETDAGALVPAVKEFVLSVDIKAKKITVRDVPGLIAEEQEAVGGANDDSEADEADADADADADAEIETNVAPIVAATDASDQGSALERLGKRRFGSKR